MWQSPTALLCPLRGIEARSPAGRRQKSAAQCPHQGINRQIRRMCADAALTILRLRRVRIGSLPRGSCSPDGAGKCPVRVEENGFPSLSLCSCSSQESELLAPFESSILSL